MRPSVNSSFIAAISFLPNSVREKNINIIVPALARADIILTDAATNCGSLAKRVKILPINIKVGAPGGWPTSSLKQQAMYSPQSQKLAVGSIVDT